MSNQANRFSPSAARYSRSKIWKNEDLLTPTMTPEAVPAPVVSVVYILVKRGEDITDIMRSKAHGAWSTDVIATIR